LFNATRGLEKSCGRMYSAVEKSAIGCSLSKSPEFCFRRTEFIYLADEDFGNARCRGYEAA